MSRRKGKPQGKKDRKFVDKVTETDKGGVSRTNDVPWYAMNPELLRAAASIPFSNAVGTSYTFDNRIQFVPGIMVFSVIPCPSTLSDPTSALNVAATASYSYVRHANSGSPNYDSPDLMLYELAVANIYSYINFLQRVYGVAMLYAHGNRYLPEALINAMGVDFQSVHESMADFRYGINVLIHKAASLACPGNMPYFDREAFLFSGIYAEGESIKSQLYFYNPIGFMEYSETASGDQGGGLTLKELRVNYSKLLTVPELIEYGSQLLAPILSSEDMNIMSGDILKAYGSDGILKLAPMDEFYTVIPATDLTVLEQMQNCDVFADHRTTESPTEVFNWDASVLQTTGSITSGPYLLPTVKIVSQIDETLPTYRSITQKLLPRVTASHLLTTILTDPQPGDVIERTRGMINIIDTSISGSNIIQVKALGSADIVVDCVVYQYYMNDTGLALDRLQCVPISVTGGQFAETENSLAYRHCVMENFKFHPKMYYYALKDGAPDTQVTSYAYTNMAVDIDNYTLISENELQKMNEMAMLSLFTVPSIARAY